MQKYSYFYMGKRFGKSDKGPYYCVTIAVKEPTMGKVFSIELYVDPAIYNVCEELQEFQPVDCIFAPTTMGRCKLIFLSAS